MSNEDHEGTIFLIGTFLGAFLMFMIVLSIMRHQTGVSAADWDEAEAKCAGSLEFVYLDGDYDCEAKISVTWPPENPDPKQYTSFDGCNWCDGTACTTLHCDPRYP